MADNLSGAKPDNGSQTAGTPEVKQPEIKTFTQDEVNALIGKEKKDVQEKILKELGIDDVKNAKDGLKKLKEYQDSQKTEAEKWKGEYDNLKKASDELKTKHELSEAKFTAIAKGVIPERAEKVVKLAMSYQGETIEQKIDAVLKDFPELLKVPGTPSNIGTATNNQSMSELEKIKAEMMKGFGIVDKKG